MAEILLIEGHRLMRSALRDLVTQSGCESVAEAFDPAEAVHQTRRQSPQIIILDSNWQEFGGLYLSRILRELAPESKILLLVDDSRLADAETARSSGADAFVAKNALTQELPPILRQWRARAEPDEPLQWSMA